MLLRSGKRCNPNQSDMEENLNKLNEKFNFLFREVQSIKLEIQDNQLKIEMLENNPNEKITGGCRTNRENRNNKRRDESILILRDDDDEIVRRIKINPPTFDYVHDSDWLADYFDYTGYPRT